MLTLGQLVIPFVPTVFSHLLLLTDSKHLSYLLNTKPSMWYIAGVSASDMHRYTSLYDMCFDLGTKKFYANSTWKNRIMVSKKTTLQDRRLCSDWMEYFSEHQSEFGLFQRIQSYLRLLITFVVDESRVDSNRDLFSSLEDRVLEIRKGRLYSILCEAWKAEEEERIATKVASEALAERSRHSDISLQTLYDAVFLLKYSEYLPAEVLESIYYDIELLTKEHKYILHFIVALYSYDADLSLLLRGLFSASEVVQSRTLRIFNQIRTNRPTDVFTMNVSPVHAAAFSG